MDNKPKRPLLWLGLGLVTLSGLVWWGVTQVFEPTVKSEKPKVEVTAEQIHLLGEEGDFVVAPKELKGVSSRYVLTRYKKNQTLSQEEQGNKVVLYDLSQTKMKIVVDLKKGVHTYDSKVAYTSFGGDMDVRLYQSQGTEFLDIGYLTKEEVDSEGFPNVDKVDLALNMDTLEVVSKPDYEDYELFMDFFDYAFLKEDFMKSVSTIYSVERLLNYMTINVPQGDKTANQEINLFHDHPELKDKFLSGDYKLFFRPGQDRVERQFNTLLYWFAPVGQERIELHATDQETGEKTLITSYADYQAWATTHTTE